MDDRKAAVGYARQSLGRPDRSAGSVRAQLAACRAEMVARGYRCEGEYVDEAVSACRRDSDRPEFERMPADVRRDGLTIRQLIVVPEEAEVIRDVVRGILAHKDEEASAGRRHPGSLSGGF
ncbi:recombinase family protein [Streptomyces sp. NPDC048277]|uniref:recombinase family protein n=1 Tax=Streptomyces sp. NPDC048277 TaxID=3155027 RepID=UPI0033F34A49